jgi:hypothetical protein
VAELEGSDLDAFELLSATFAEYGLGDLTDLIKNYITEGYGDDTIVLKLRQTPEYAKRFAGNELLRKAGKAPLDEATYVDVENEMKNAMIFYGLSEDYYQRDDLAKMIGGSVSPNEVRDRVKSAYELVNSTPSSVRDEYARLYGVTSIDLMGAFLNPEVAKPLIDKRIATATISGAAMDQGISSTLTEQIREVNPNLTYAQAAQGFSQVQQLGTRGQELSSIYGDQYGIEEATQETFGLAGGAKAETTKKKLASKERASFSGSSAVRAGSLAQEKGGI